MKTAKMKIEGEPEPLPNQFFMVCPKPDGFFQLKA